MGRSGNSALLLNQRSCAEQLARFFPQAAPVKIPVAVISTRGGTSHLREATVVEFSSADHAIFLSTLPLEFGDLVKLEATVKGIFTEATVEAVQYHEGSKAVAVKFLTGRGNWVVRPS